MADPALTPSAFKLTQSSPLDTLVRKTSQRRDKTPLHSPASHVRTSRGEPGLSTNQSQSSEFYDANNNNDVYNHSRMPILHANFSRDSTATASTGTGVWYADGQSYADDTSMYSDSYGDSSALRESWSTGTGTAYGTMLDNIAPVPSVVVSPIILDSPQFTKRHAGRTPSAGPAAANFSKPLRNLTPEMEDSKRRVLERNRYPSSPLAQQQHPPRNPSPLQQPAGSYFEQPRPAPSPTPSLTSTAASTHLSPNPALSLPRKPPSLRAASPTSLYSDYSYYGSQPPTPTAPNNGHTSSPLSSRAHLSPTPTNAKPTPEDYLSLGIASHEANDLRTSASYFLQAATEGGGCGVGMLMWGLTLRHGWGVTQDEKAAFKWLRKAAESAVGDLEGARKGGKGGADMTGVKSELVLAIYEVAQCFFHGWGVTKDQKMAVSYYQVAARLGDADAQNDLGFCLANGRGCKKDRKEAAKWYRAAVQQGASDVGLAWIYKEKFQ